MAQPLPNRLQSTLSTLLLLGLSLFLAPPYRMETPAYNAWYSSAAHVCKSRSPYAALSLATVGR
ncbi:hypothetical protein [Sporisorium scitamineum]|uniref:Uncharacterized protein n=1 Tax=Sporisorium scitamineum TaxID=49012 RepID=A0A0F7RY92_9BASI|nr:hypothetical protein [Sporisorium scitamineum]